MVWSIVVLYHLHVKASSLYGPKKLDNIRPTLLSNIGAVREDITATIIIQFCILNQFKQNYKTVMSSTKKFGRYIKAINILQRQFS